MYRRNFVTGTFVAALQAVSGQSLAAHPAGLAVTARLADAIWQDLPSAEIRKLKGVAGRLSVERGQAAPPDLNKLMAADFRAGCTLLVRGVRFSRTELAWYLLRAGYL